MLLILVKKEINNNITIDNFHNYKNYNLDDIKYLNDNNIILNKNKNIIENIIDFIYKSIIVNYNKKTTIENIKKYHINLLLKCLGSFKIVSHFGVICLLFCLLYFKF